MNKLIVSLVMIALTTTPLASSPHPPKKQNFESTSIPSCCNNTTAECACGSSCNCCSACPCKNNNSFPPITRGKLSAKKILNAVAKAFIHVSSLLHAKSNHDKIATQAAILNLIETGIELAAESSEAEAPQKTLDSRYVKIIEITGEMVQNITQSTLNTQSVNEYKRYNNKQSGHFTISAQSQDERERLICLNYVKNLAAISEEIINDEDPSLTPHIHNLLKNLLAWVSNGDIIFEKKGIDQHDKSTQKDNLQTVGNLKIINKKDKQ